MPEAKLKLPNGLKLKLFDVQIVVNNIKCTKKSYLCALQQMLLS